MSIRNSVSLIGNLGAAPTVTTLESGTVITEFSLATNEYFRDRDGNRQTRTMWHTVKAFGKVAEILGQYLDSGSQVAIDGRISYRKWIDKHEQVRISTEIIVEDFTFLSSARQGEDAAGGDADSNHPSSQIAAEPAPKREPAPQRPKSSAKTRTAKSTKQAAVSELVESDELPF